MCKGLNKRLIRILYVDDEKDFLVIAKRFLEKKWGGRFQVTSASSVEEAYEKIKEKRFDVIVADYVMPGKSGLDFLKEFREKDKLTPFILFTGRGGEETVIKAWRFGADGYVKKGTDLENMFSELVDNIERALERNILRKYVDNADVILSMIGSDFKVWFINKRGCEILGIEPEEIVGKDPTLFIPEQFRDEVVNVFERLLAGEEDKSLKYRENPLFTKDGEEKWFTWRNIVLRDSEGRPIGILSSGREITEYKKAQRELKELMEQYRRVFQGLRDEIYIVDQNGQILETNDKACLETGFTEKELLNMKIWEINEGMTEKDWLALKRKIDEKDKDGFVFETKHKRKDGSIYWVEVSSQPIIYRGKKAYLGVNRNISERKEAEERLEEFTYMVSHELNAPLRSIVAYATFLLEDYSDKLDEQGKKYLERLKENSLRLQEMIKDLLTLSRVGRGAVEFEKVDLNQLVDEVRESLGESRGEVIYSNLPTIEASRVQMKQLFQNLIDNGLKFNESKKPVVKIECKVEGEMYHFKVIDNGIGIRKEDQEKIFKPFTRLHPLKYKGTGIGLSICKKIVETLGGKIWVESEPNKGSVFHFTLPKKKHSEGTPPKLFIKES